MQSQIWFFSFFRMCAKCSELPSYMRTIMCVALAKKKCFVPPKQWKLSRMFLMRKRAERGWVHFFTPSPPHTHTHLSYGSFFFCRFSVYPAYMISLKFHMWYDMYIMHNYIFISLLISISVRSKQYLNIALIFDNSNCFIYVITIKGDFNSH